MCVYYSISSFLAGKGLSPYKTAKQDGIQTTNKLSLNMWAEKANFGADQGIMLHSEGSSEPNLTQLQLLIGK